MQRRKRVAPRSRMDIMANILTAAKRPSRKTRIMYRCNLSFRQLKTYLTLLLEEGFLSVIPIVESARAEAFQVTAKGRAFLEAYANLRATFPRSGTR